ncbi:FAD binding domain-containing protein [Roseitranquillus sediminis]|uniref:FAD binding domain-containing protein n=1 Tax=Roseitranquillus sediminis TaxID=2809051 RepID=UPI001D0CC8AC|nr:xanthine dehydrogenase family protein subunit M [Roseitranquillus sediminis]MBM9593661.1 xanthine dehydrogenase family protein subunit M [Roseitranquillus sediminis]
MYAFDIKRPRSVEEAVAALADGEAQALGGGQTLIPTLRQRLADPGTLVSLSGIAELKYVRMEGDVLRIGGGTTHAQVAREAAAHYPALASLAGRIGDPAVRNRGTIGGSLANNDPSACYPAGALGSNATVVTGAREIAADDFFQGLFETALDEGEIVTEVRFPVPEAARYEKFIQPASRFALVAVFVARFAGGVRVAVTGASESGVFRWAEAEAALAADFTPEVVRGLTVQAEGMIGDLHGSAEYRAHLVGVITRRAVEGALA